MKRVYGALLVAMLVVCCVCAECGCVRESRWLAGCMGFLWLTGFSFFHCVASPFHSFVTTQKPPQHTAQITCSRHRGCVATYAVAITKVCGRVEAAGGRTPQLSVTERQEPALPPLVGPLCVFRRIGTDCANELLCE